MTNIYILYLHNSGIGASIKRDVIHLSNKDGGNSDKQSCPIHIDCGPDRKDKLGDAWVNTVLFHATEIDWECCSTLKYTFVSL